ncbi:putative fatty acyl-CoA reductase CG5065 [Anticarsia gemmatalis]|uniref:putative fatty acyl-CoA reductase CG5065 n=1 Tax=Anticarsia gemmatalis TaxID=129554 RepID=UPI003F764238
MSDASTKACSTYQPVADFYAGKSVFITGGTGFLGKVFVEKLLYSCSKLDKIYLLIRDKKGVDIKRRLENLFDDPLFTRVIESNKNSINKVVPIAGDITLPNLGIKPEDENTLIDNVSVVIHSAATVKFNEPLPVAININFEGTQKVLNLSKRIKDLEAFVYISTAFAHTNRRVLSETIYPAPAKLETVYNFMEEHGHNKKETMKFIHSRPNTYAFSKALTETYIAENHGDLPTVIVRPSIVTSTANEPMKGWTCSWNGATRLMYNIGKGYTPIIFGSPKTTAGDMIPVDYVSNLTIVAATKARESKEAQVFNITTSAENPVTWHEGYQYSIEECIKNGYNELPVFVITSKSRVVVDFLTVVLQKIPAHIADFWLRMTGKPPKYVHTTNQALIIRDVIGPFSSGSWLMKADRTRELYSKLSPEDKKTFPCDPALIFWPDYFKHFIRGIYKYLKPGQAKR